MTDFITINKKFASFKNVLNELHIDNNEYIEKIFKLSVLEFIMIISQQSAMINASDADLLKIFKIDSERVDAVNIKLIRRYIDYFYEVSKVF